MNTLDVKIAARDTYNYITGSDLKQRAILLHSSYVRLENTNIADVQSTHRLEHIRRRSQVVAGFLPTIASGVFGYFSYTTWNSPQMTPFVASIISLAVSEGFRIVARGLYDADIRSFGAQYRKRVKENISKPWAKDTDWWRSD